MNGVCMCVCVLSSIESAHDAYECRFAFIPFRRFIILLRVLCAYLRCGCVCARFIIVIVMEARYSRPTSIFTNMKLSVRRYQWNCVFLCVSLWETVVGIVVVRHGKGVRHIEKNTMRSIQQSCYTTFNHHTKFIQSKILSFNLLHMRYAWYVVTQVARAFVFRCSFMCIDKIEKILHRWISLLPLVLCRLLVAGIRYICRFIFDETNDEKWQTR